MGRPGNWKSACKSRLGVCKEEQSKSADIVLVCGWIPSTAQGISKSHEIKFKHHGSREQKNGFER
jgi:hypothetical protein